jgi:riboflavin-specific deaminase-like protein
MMEHLRESRNIDNLRQSLQHIKSHCRQTSRPFVLVSYAQSIDGSIATKDRRPLKISGQASMVLTHRLRSFFDAILVGIDTVLADNPQLTVRLVQGENPQPVVLDTHLRIPVESRLLKRSDCRSWLVSAKGNSEARTGAIKRTGATVLPCELDDRGQIDIRRLMGILHDRGICSLMVEGGAKVITSFIRAKLVDLFIITISPFLIGGLRVVQEQGESPLSKLHLTDVHYERLGDDLILWAKPVWNHP